MVHSLSEELDVVFFRGLEFKTVALDECWS